jgi:hypothetical protein
MGHFSSIDLSIWIVACNSHRYLKSLFIKVVFGEKVTGINKELLL